MQLAQQQEREVTVREFVVAAAQGDVATVRRLCEQPGLLDAGTALHGVSALHKACMYDQPRVVELLLERGASIDVRDVGGRTPLMLVAANGHSGLLRTLPATEHMTDVCASAVRSACVARCLGQR